MPAGGVAVGGVGAGGVGAGGVGAGGVAAGGVAAGGLVDKGNLCTLSKRVCTVTSKRNDLFQCTIFAEVPQHRECINQYRKHTGKNEFSRAPTRGG
jgi:hypothetical protein